MNINRISRSILLSNNNYYCINGYRDSINYHIYTWTMCKKKKRNINFFFYRGIMNIDGREISHDSQFPDGNSILGKILIFLSRIIDRGARIIPAGYE